MKRRNNSLPDETEMVEVFSADNSSVAALISSRRRDTVLAVYNIYIYTYIIVVEELVSKDQIMDTIDSLNRVNNSHGTIISTISQ